MIDRHFTSDYIPPLFTWQSSPVRTISRWHIIKQKFAEVHTPTLSQLFCFPSLFSLFFSKIEACDIHSVFVFLTSVWQCSTEQFNSWFVEIHFWAPVTSAKKHEQGARIQEGVIKCHILHVVKKKSACFQQWKYDIQRCTLKGVQLRCCHWQHKCVSCWADTRRFTMMGVDLFQPN